MHAAAIRMLFFIKLLWEESGSLEYLDWEGFMTFIHQHVLFEDPEEEKAQGPVCSWLIGSYNQAFDI
jgi:hypothetical protein